MALIANYTFLKFINIVCRPIEISYIVEDGEIKTYFYNSIEGNEF